MGSVMDWLLGLLISGVIAFVAYRRNRLDRAGAYSAVVVGTVIYVTGGWLFTGMMLFFFASANVLSRWSKEKSSPRNARQVLANGGVATLLSVLFYLTNDSFYIVVYASSIAVATADTWASELGALSPTLPRHLLNFQPVPHGTDGGVTWIGLLASIAGALSISLFVGGSLIVLIAGVVGSLLDSFFGVFQVKPKTLHEATKELQGIPWLTNDMVNFLSQVVVITVLLITG